jgi:hypothetical protein
MRFLPCWIARLRHRPRWLRPAKRSGCAKRTRTPRKGGRLPRVESAYKQQNCGRRQTRRHSRRRSDHRGVHDNNTLSALDEVPRVTGRSITIATMDAGYGVASVSAELEARRIEAIVPTRREPSPKKGLFPPVGSNVQTGCATRSSPLSARSASCSA